MKRKAIEHIEATPEVNLAVSIPVVNVEHVSAKGDKRVWVTVSQSLNLEPMKSDDIEM